MLTDRMAALRTDIGQIKDDLRAITASATPMMQRPANGLNGLDNASVQNQGQLLRQKH